MDKKANSGYGARWFIAILIYYILFLVVLTLVAPLQGMQYTQQGIREYCDDPRYIYSPFSEDIKIENRLWKVSHLDCSQSVGVLNQQTCNLIDGCNWETSSTGWWIFKSETDASCFGDINATYYGIETYTGGILTNEVSSHTNTKDKASFVGSICNHPNVIYNQTLCQTFSCSWNDFSTITETNLNQIQVEETSVLGLKSLWSTTKDLFTLRYDFGVGGFIGFIFSLIFFIIPTIILILSFYVMVRG